MPRLKTRKALRGGAVPYLDPAVLRYTGIESMIKDLSLYTISAHGETTADKYFLVVPEKTYIVFSAHSGKSAYSGIEEVKHFMGYGPRESVYDYYRKLYTQLFKPIEARKIAGIPQLEEDIYIYEPGDIIPDYKLFFKNMPNFIFMHGIYSLPIRSISGPNVTRSSEHWGQTKAVIKQLLNEGKIAPEILNDIDPRDKLDILERTPKELETGYSIYNPKKIYDSQVMRIINSVCCNENPDNLLFKPPMSEKLLKKQNNELRMSYVLNTIPLQEGTSRRFFFCHFCRVSFDEYLTSLKVLLRTASFSGKCSSAQDKSQGFNVMRLAARFCNLPPILKINILGTESGVDFIKFLKKVVKTPSSTTTWAQCIPRKYIHVVDQDYTGALELEDLLTINGASISISKLITEYKNEINSRKISIRRAGTGANTAEIQKEITTLSSLLQLLREFYKPIKQFHSKYSHISNNTYEESSMRARLSREIYRKINRKLTTVKLVLYKEDGEYKDPLYFNTSSLWLLELFNERLDTIEYDSTFAEINTAMRASMDKDADDVQDDLILELDTHFSLYKGVAPIPANNRTKILPFNPEIPENEENDKENEDDENVYEANERNLNLGGGRLKRKTRKHRLISKK